MSNRLPKAYWSDTDWLRICLPYTAYQMLLCYLLVRYLHGESRTENKSHFRGLDSLLNIPVVQSLHSSWE